MNPKAVAVRMPPCTYAGRRCYVAFGVPALTRAQPDPHAVRFTIPIRLVHVTRAEILLGRLFALIALLRMLGRIAEIRSFWEAVPDA